MLSVNYYIIDDGFIRFSVKVFQSLFLVIFCCYRIFFVMSTHQFFLIRICHRDDGFKWKGYH